MPYGIYLSLQRKVRFSRGKRFGNHIAEYAGCMYNPENDTMYEAVEVEYKPLLADFGLKLYR